MASQNTDNSAACSTAFSGEQERKHHRLALLVLLGNPPATDGFSSQKGALAEIVIILRYYALMPPCRCFQ